MPNVQHWSECEPLNKDDDNFANQFLIPDFGGSLIELGLVLTIYGAASGAIAAAALTLFVEKVLGGAVHEGCLWGTWLLGALVYTLIAAAAWFDNKRLACRESDACAVGTVVHDPHSNGNGDLTLDLALAPFDTAAQQEAVRGALQAEEGIGTTSEIDMYISLAALTAKQRLNVYEHSVNDYYLQWDADRRFQEKYFLLGNDLDQYIQSGDFKPPFYRCPSDDEDDSEKMPIPSQIDDSVLQNTYVYLPAVMEGHVYVEWLKNLRNAAIAATVGFAAGCAVCIYFTGDEHNCAWVGAAVAAILAFLAWLLSHLFNNPSDTKADGGHASVVDPTADPGTTPTSMSAERGDVVVVHGSWVLFKYSNQYYEIHPVTAWYLLCRSNFPDPHPTLKTQQCDFSTERMTADDYERICRLVDAAERAQPEGTLRLPLAAAMSMSGGIN